MFPLFLLDAQTMQTRLWSLTTIIDRDCLFSVSGSHGKRREEKGKTHEHFNVAASRLSARLSESASGGKVCPAKLTASAPVKRQKKKTLSPYNNGPSSTARVPPFVLPSRPFSPTLEALPCNQQWSTGKTPSQLSTSLVRLAPFFLICDFCLFVVFANFFV
jgi:hypothetical protein